MEQLEAIIEEGNKIRDSTIVPTINERLSLKVSILSLLGNIDSEIFVMNRKLFSWKQKLVNGEIKLPDKVEDMDNYEFVEKLSIWLLDPLLIFCNNPEEVKKKISDELFKKGYEYVRARNDIYPSRINIDVEFDVAAILMQTNKNLTKHIEKFTLYGANLNLNGELMLPIFLYDYITPRFNYEEWKSDLELEPFLWTKCKNLWIKKGVNFPPIPKIELSNKIFNIIKSEKEGTYLLTGLFTMFLMTNQQGTYTGEYQIYHQNPEEFIKKIAAEIPGIKFKEEEPIYYFQNKSYQIFFNNDLILTIYLLEYQMNFIRIGYYNHTNYHGVLLHLLLDAIKAPVKDYDEKILYIGYLIKYKNEILNSQVNNEKKMVFEILQNNSIGPQTTPMLEFKKKEWNKELTFFYRPNKEQEKEEEDNLT